MSTLLTPTIRQSIAALASRQLLTPALLYVAGHRPLAFLAGQGLFLAEPITAMLGIGAVSEWATLLSDPDGPAELETALRRRQMHDAVSSGDAR